MSTVITADNITREIFHEGTDIEVVIEFDTEYNEYSVSMTGDYIGSRATYAEAYRLRQDAVSQRLRFLNRKVV